MDGAAGNRPIFFSEAIRIPRETVDALLAGRQDFTAELAGQWEWMLGLDDGALMEMQKVYDTARAEHQSRFKSSQELAIEFDACLERDSRADFLLSLRAVVRRIPACAMVRLGQGMGVRVPMGHACGGMGYPIEAGRLLPRLAH